MSFGGLGFDWGPGGLELEGFRKVWWVCGVGLTDACSSRIKIEQKQKGQSKPKLGPPDPKACIMFEDGQKQCE